MTIVLGFVVLTALIWVCGGPSPGYEREGNIFIVRMPDGWAEVEWISSSTFRFCRGWGPAAAFGKPINAERQDVKVREQTGNLEFLTRYLKVRLDTGGGRVMVENAEGQRLLGEAAPPHWDGRTARLEREGRAGERFRGLGVQAGLDAVADPGAKIETDRPWLMSSLGYGEYFPAPGRYVYEFGERRRVTVPTSGRVEYFFYYGPTAKEILEEHVTITGGIKEFDWADFRVTRRLPKEAVLLPAVEASWEGLGETLRYLMRASYSAITLPAVDAAAYSSAPVSLRRRAEQLMLFLPVVYSSGKNEGSPERDWLFRERWRLAPYLVSYAYEAQERGVPLVRPPAMQYPKDSEASRYEDEFFVGDDLLVAPILGPEGRRRVYLPMGFWTEWHTSRRYSGRQVVEIMAGRDWIPVFVRNGSIVPLAPVEKEQTMTLHYFPRPPAEFFLYEEGSGALTQLRATPAGELLRLEIETARRRTYEWVIHHLERCRKVVAGDLEYVETASRDQLTTGRWWYDGERGTLHIQTQVMAGTRNVIYVSF